MLELSKKTSENNGQEIEIKTNEGEFIISKELDDYDYENDSEAELVHDIYLGFYQKSENSDQVKVFTITDEDYYIYNCFLELANVISEYNMYDQSELISEDSSYNDAEKSSVKFTIDEEHKAIYIKFNKSKSKTHFNTFFVKKESIEYEFDPKNTYINQFFEKLYAYTADKSQISIFDLENNGISRVRTNASKVSK